MNSQRDSNLYSIQVFFKSKVQQCVRLYTLLLLGHSTSRNVVLYDSKPVVQFVNYIMLETIHMHSDHSRNTYQDHSDQ